LEERQSVCFYPQGFCKKTLHAVLVVLLIKYLLTGGLNVNDIIFLECTSMPLWWGGKMCKLSPEHPFAISMDGRGRALDNVFIERLWWTVKYENIYPKSYAD